MPIEELLEKAAKFDIGELGEPGEVAPAMTLVGKLRQHYEEEERRKKMIIIPHGTNYALEFNLEDVENVNEIADKPDEVVVSVRKEAKCLVHKNEDIHPGYSIIQQGSSWGILAEYGSAMSCCTCGWNTHYAVC